MKKTDSGNWTLVGDFTPEQKMKLAAYANLLTEWNAKLNLVSPSTISELWTRHIEDSAQLTEHLPLDAAIIDVGSGAGLPGMILSILGYAKMQLVESDQRKSVFLQEAARVCAVAPQIHMARVEALKNTKADIITARAFAPLDQLLKLTAHLGGHYVLLKGENVMDEIREAGRGWLFDYALHPSRTGPGFIVTIQNLKEKL